MSKRSLLIWQPFLGALVAFAVAVPAYADDPTPKRPITLGIKTDRTRYDKDDTIMVIATFKGQKATMIQLSTAGGGGAYFRLILEAIGRKSEPICQPVSYLQFQEHMEVEGIGRENTRWAQEVVSGGTSHQFAIHLPRLRGLTEGEYRMRIGYTRRHYEELRNLAEQALGQKVRMGGGLTELVEGAWDGAVLSEPVTITVGPAHIAPAPRPVKP